MNFGPLTPQELDSLAKYLQNENIGFEIHFNESAAKEELQDSPQNLLSLAEFRTKNYMAQHYYIMIDDETLINRPEIQKKIFKMITNHDVDDFQEPAPEEVTSLVDERAYKSKIERNKWIQKIFAALFLASILWGFIESLRK